jgi:hypothetical protein
MLLQQSPALLALLWCEAKNFLLVPFQDEIDSGVTEVTDTVK